MPKRGLYVSGLPRSGSTLICQLLSLHPQVHSPRHSSPLCQALVGMRTQLSDSPFLLAQLDVDFESGYQRLLRAYRGFINGWFDETDRAWVVDKNRGWLQHLELLHLLDPNCRLLVCVRELGQIYGSIEHQHDRTRLIDFPDHIAALSRADRAKQLFADEGVVGSPLKALEAVQDIRDDLQQNLYYVVFEHLVSEPQEVLHGIFQWLELPPTDLDIKNLPVTAHESDSYYHFKYPHTVRSSITPPQKHLIPQRFEQTLKQTFGWYYDTFYPGLR